jgi:hypothetical protein
MASSTFYPRSQWIMAVILQVYGKKRRILNYSNSYGTNRNQIYLKVFTEGSIIMAQTAFRIKFTTGY